MQVITPTTKQALSIVQTMHAVATAEGALPLLPVEHDSILAIQRHLLHLDEPLEPPALSVPADLAATIDSPLMRRETVRILAMVPVLDKQVLDAKVRLVEAVAAQLGVDEYGVGLLRLAQERKFRKLAFRLMMRSVAHYWSPTGRARLRDWLDMIRIAMPAIPGVYAMLVDRGLLERYRGLEHRPEGTLGHGLFRFYRDRGFPMPGEPKSFPEGWSKHEVYHIISEYETSLQGEMLNAAFSGGNTEVLCMDLLLLSLLQFQAGFQVMPGPVLQDELRPDAFFRAVARGAATEVDILAEWDLWSAVDQPVAELRRRYKVPALRPEERQWLAENGSLLA
ncbi:hypothetical protein [Falsiroseomonas stagni]|uniref:Uncharacterized protein n=1 Tax=Falsiroseomonas stagni DSM 19981 TaxID=1123062 RepID=A0A1I3ZIF6_9PROT|nr:hypothetical protein [Falsiroseomonas stagni]SFK43854.1 hypothetical protein SAMN02745775_102532 [Falsiroseomonas stagni DSM 19981]